MVDTKERRALIIGWDGGSFVVLDKMIERGLMPCLSDLIDKSVKSEFTSTIPPITAPAWTSFRTGKRPDNHGIFSFFKPPHASLDIKDIVRNDARNIKANTFWNILNENARKVVVADMPFTDPVEELDGAMVSGMMTRGRRGALAYPQGLPEEICAAFPGHFKKTLTDGIDVSLAYLDHLILSLEQKKDLDLYLMKQYQWACFVTIFSAVDTLQHYFWKYIDPTSTVYAEDARFSAKIDTFYQKLDEILRAYTEQMDEDDLVFIVSDHGFGPADYVVYVNSILEKTGFLTFTEEKAYSLKKRIDKTRVRNLIRTFDFLHLRKRIRKETRERVKKAFLSDDLPVRWDKTKAYFRTTGEEGIYINKTKRFDHGVVDDANYDTIVASLVEVLQDLRNPENGEKVFDFVRKRSDVYKGKSTDDAPDIIVGPKKGYLLKRHKPGSKVIDVARDPFLTGTHRPEGIFVAKGSPFKKRQRPGPLKIEDFTPILLYSLNVPLPKDLDGNVSLAIFNDNFKDSCRIAYKDYEGIREKVFQDALGSADDKEIKKQLSQLGYID